MADAQAPSPQDTLQFALGELKGTVAAQGQRVEDLKDAVKDIPQRVYEVINPRLEAVESDVLAINGRLVVVEQRHWKTAGAAGVVSLIISIIPIAIGLGWKGLTK